MPTSVSPVSSSETDDIGGEARWRALKTLLDVFGKGRSLGEALDAHCPDHNREGSLTRELCYGVLRWYPRIDALIETLTERPLRSRDQDVRLMAALGIYQLLYTRIPDYAAINETVTLADRRRKRWARPLLNALLRRLQRERAGLLQTVDASDAARLAHPPWLLGLLRSAWPEDWKSILAANNQRPPMSLRVNPGRTNREEYREALSEMGLAARLGAYSHQALVLERPVDVHRLPGFAKGVVSVQDEAAQLAAGLLAPSAGERILDACAAPGGKSTHLLELQPALGELVALDSSPERLGRLEDNLARLRLRARVVQGDATDPDSWWDGVAFHRILLDAPCSGTGVIRRHPDIKLLRRPADVDTLSGRQARLLAALWPLLAPGGTLLYATCSVLPQENELLIKGFARAHPDAIFPTIRATWGRPRSVGRQILAAEGDMDGFFYALARKC